MTGTGVVTSIGCDVETFWLGLLTGASGAAPIQAFDTSVYDAIGTQRSLVLARP